LTHGFDDDEIARALRQVATRSGSRRRDSRRSDAADAALLARLIARGLVAQNESGAVHVTAAGSAFLRRWLAGADGYSAQHQARTIKVVDHDDLGPQTVVVDLDESPLGWLRRHKGRDGRPLINAAEFAAGERLRSDYSRGQIMPRVTANWTATVARGRRDGGAGGIAELTEAAIAARQRVDRALDAVGPEFAGALVDFCCFLKRIEEIEQSRAWPARSAKLVIRLALAALARHYGLQATARGASGSGRVRHWGSPDYRPALDPEG
jgi:hypothetical protein